MEHSHRRAVILAGGDGLRLLVPRILSQAVLATMPGALAVIPADDLGWSDLGDPVRVLSPAHRKRIERAWRLDQDTERSLVAGA